ncbi:MAG TPA: hypothetical protein PLB00_01560 [Pseudomonadota bacterium]|nr:hypothetical protein [Pseudomonadota bacterium]
MRPFFRFVLTSVALVTALPLALWWGVIWVPSQRGCVPLAWDKGASMRYRAYSTFLDGAQDSPRNPHRRPDSLKGRVSAYLALGDAAKAVEVSAWNDLSYVSCDLDESERDALVGFSEFRDARLARLLAKAGTTDESGLAAREALLRATGDAIQSPDDPPAIAPDALIAVLARYQPWYPHWWPNDYASPSRAPLFTPRGLLAQGDLPDQVFWVAFHHSVPTS